MYLCQQTGSNTANESFEGNFFKKAGLEIGCRSINGVLRLGSNASWEKYPSEGHWCIQESPCASGIVPEEQGSLSGA